MMTRLARVIDSSGLGLDGLSEHRYGLEQALHVAHDGPRLPPVGSDDHHRGALARGEEASPINEAGEEHCSQGEDEGLARAATADEPSLNRADDRR